MHMKAFAIYDSKAEAHIPPFFHGATGEAIRSFETAANNPEHQFHNHAADYTLFEIGSFDQVKGLLIPLEKTINLGCALHFRKDAGQASPGQMTILPTAAN